MMMMMMNCFCGIVDRRKVFSLISSRDHCQRSSPSRISDTPRAGFEPAQNLNWGLVEWSCAAVITTTPRRHHIAIKWSSKKIRSLFRLRDPHPACKIYEGICSCSANYISETKRNFETRWNEHENPNKDSELDKDLRGFPGHKCDWKILLTAPTNLEWRNILESTMIALKQPSLNVQRDFDHWFY